eukprot:777273-Rhodomonas_salina.1
MLLTGRRGNAHTRDRTAGTAPPYHATDALRDVRYCQRCYAAMCALSGMLNLHTRYPSTLLLDIGDAAMLLCIRFAMSGTDIGYAGFVPGIRRRV